MDDDDYYLMESLADEGNLDEADQFDLAVVATFILVGVSARQQDWAEHHHLHRLYLLHSHLMPCPQRDTPWQQLYASKSKQAFITTMGVSVKTFQFVLKQGFHMAWDSLPIPHTDVLQSGNPHLVQRSLDAAGALGLILHYLNSTMCEVSLQQIFALIPATVSCYISFALQILLHTL